MLIWWGAKKMKKTAQKAVFFMNSYEFLIFSAKKFHFPLKLEPNYYPTLCNTFGGAKFCIHR
jgi:hypothetical protein